MWCQALVAIQDVLDRGLPDKFSPKLFNDKCELVYEHVYDSYPGEGRGVFAVMKEKRLVGGGVSPPISSPLEHDRPKDVCHTTNPNQQEENDQCRKHLCDSRSPRR